MRSQRTDCLTYPNVSDHIYGPQIQGAVGSGNTIIGPGYKNTIGVDCKCTNVGDAALSYSRKLSATDRTAVLNLLNTTEIPFMYMGSMMNVSESNGVDFNLVLGNTGVCGGYSQTMVPVCSVKLDHPEDVIVSSTFETDGTTASIALVNSEVYDTLPADQQTLTNTALAVAFRTIFTPGTHYPLVSTVPGMISALLYWTSRELASISPTLLEPGVETFVAILLRAGMQRAFDTQGSSCNQYVNVPTAAFVSLTPWGIVSVLLAGAIQLVVTIVALGLACTWYLLQNPIGPAVRILRDPVYFTTLLGDSPFNSFLQGTNNAPNHVVWQALDTLVRVGESLEPLDDFVGQIKLER
jgi:hypothetical protein